MFDESLMVLYNNKSWIVSRQYGIIGGTYDNYIYLKPYYINGLEGWQTFNQLDAYVGKGYKYNRRENNGQVHSKINNK